MKLIPRALILTRHFKNAILTPWIAEYSGQTLEGISRRTGASCSLALGALIGKGYFGNVYRLEKGPASSIPLVAKVPHRMKGIGARHLLQILEDATEREWKTLEAITPLIYKLEANEHFPKNPHWPKGQLPTIPLIDLIHTQAGAVLLKPEIKTAPMPGPTAELKAQVKALYELAQAISAVLKFRGFPFSFDLRQENLFWAEDPQTLSILGYEKPGLALFEADRTVFNFPFFLERFNSFQDYWEEFLKFHPPEALKQK